jgi:hypothetical protein
VWPNLLIGSCFFIVLHVMIWFSTNLQFMSSAISEKSMVVTLCLSVPISLCAYYGSRYTYAALENSVWAVRFIGFGTSYLVFPLLTWVLLKESMLTPKTMVCIFLSIIIVSIQVFWK